jgi:DNA invertase Pin-like site-specific DNA recombinase
VEVRDVVALAQATDDNDPRRALDAAAELRKAADRLEAAVVRRARVGGMPWSEIAKHLGVSKQAVHKKYGKR